MSQQTDFFDEGIDAYGRGELRKSCPYAEDTDECEEWLEGWDEANSLNRNGSCPRVAKVQPLAQ